MPDYLIGWDTEHWAVDPREAAEKAWRDRSASGSIANTFQVTDTATGARVTVDLSAPPEELSGPFPMSRVFGFQIPLGVEVAVLADTATAAWGLLDNIDLDVRVVGGPVRCGLIQLVDLLERKPKLTYHQRACSSTPRR
jgi:hypothetical protein